MFLMSSKLCLSYLKMEAEMPNGALGFRLAVGTSKVKTFSIKIRNKDKMPREAESLKDKIPSIQILKAGLEGDK